MPNQYKLFLWLICATVAPAFAVTKKQYEAPQSAISAPVKAFSFTLDDAIEKALMQSPRLKAFHNAVAAAKGERVQAGVWQNPEISYSKQNFGGGVAYNAVSPPQNSYGITQLIETGGKIAARENIANKGLDIASLESQAAMLDIIRDVTVSYTEVVAAQEKLQLAIEQKKMAKDVLKSVSVRVEAAAAPLIQKSRAEVELSTATIALNKANHECDIYRKKLATLMGEERLKLMLDNAAFYIITKPQAIKLQEKMKDNPQLLSLNSRLKQSKARLDLEKANAIPNAQINLQIIEIPSVKDQAFVMGVSLPIPIFNANHGNIQKARHEVSRTEMDNRQIALNVSVELTQAYELMENAYMQAQTIKNEILPSANEAFRLARVGYGLGRFPYLEVLDAQRSLFVARQQQIDAIKDFHMFKAQVERLTATNLIPYKLGENYE